MFFTPHESVRNADVVFLKQHKFQCERVRSTRLCEMDDVETKYNPYLDNDM